MTGFLILSGGDEAVSLTIAGVATDCDGSGMPFALVKLFLFEDDTLVGAQTADASGAYSFTTPHAGEHYIVAFSASLNLAGATLPVLVGT